MPTATELNVKMEDRPGTLGRFCRALAGRGVSILGFQSYPSQGKSEVHLLVDNPAAAKASTGTNTHERRRRYAKTR
jgi:hypothetical protein